MTKSELKEFNEFESLIQSHRDTQTSHPLIKEIEKKRAEEMALLEPDRQKVLAEWKRKRCKAKKERVMAIFNSEKLHHNHHFT